MSEKADDPDRLGLAQALLVEITGRLEDLSAAAAGQQRATSNTGRLTRRLSGILVLAEAYSELMGRRSSKPFR